jgi:D-mannonate dehydratase
MGHLSSNSGDKFFGQTHSTGRLDMTDALQTVVSIKPKLENSIEVLPKHGRIMFTSSNEFSHQGSL